MEHNNVLINRLVALTYTPISYLLNKNIGVVFDRPIYTLQEGNLKLRLLPRHKINHYTNLC
jgi:hypothetical protein